jgi:quinol monooxygenase YgiN
MSASVIFVLKATVKAGKESDFERLQTELNEGSRRIEPGLRIYELSRHRTQERSYMVYGRWVDEAAQKAHNVTPIHMELAPKIMEFFEGPLDVQFYELIS